MKHAFELYINKEVITAEEFNEFYASITNYIGLLAKVRFHIMLADNHVRYFVEADKDLSALSSSITFGVLQPVDNSEVAPPTKATRESFVNFVKGGSLLDLQEKISVKRGKRLEHFVCDATRLTNTKSKIDLKMYFKNAGNQWSVAKKIGLQFPAHLFAFDFKTANTFMKKETPKYLNIEKSLHMFLPENTNALLEVDTFPYFPKPYYINLSAFEFDKHSLIVGASGSGKSKFIQLFVDRLQKLPNNYDYKVVVIDPHASLAEDLQSIGNSKIFDFHSDSAELFAGAEADITAATELTATLIKDLIGEGAYNARTERVVRFTLYVLFSAQSMSMGMMKRFLTEVELRQQMLNHVDGHIPQNISHFFATDFNEIRTAHYTDALLPIISIVDELELQPTLMGEEGASLSKAINENFMTVFSLNKVSMGEKVVKTVAGLLIQQIFLLAQSRAFSQKVILFIDEVSVVQNPALAQILSEARKFNLFVVLTQQYLNQVDKALKDSIFANISNYFCFRVSEEDAEQLVGNLPMELQKDMLVDAKDKGLKEETVKVRILTELHPRECIVRVASNGQVLPCFKAKTIDIGNERPNSKTEKPKEYKGKVVDIEKFIENRNKTAELPKIEKNIPEPIKLVPKQAPPKPVSPEFKNFDSETEGDKQLRSNLPPFLIGMDFKKIPHNRTPLDSILNQVSTKDEDSKFKGEQK
jgi:DNA helicase HerA-like ATPase